MSIYLVSATASPKFVLALGKQPLSRLTSLSTKDTSGVQQILALGLDLLT
jgi:hypothetical protein